jgi:hypothetical protein
VGKGKEVTITEDTSYPFEGSVKLTIGTEKAVRFPLDIRIPGWADSVTIQFKNRKVVARGGSEYKIIEKWQNGDQISIELPMRVRIEKRFNNSISVLRGPLYFSLRIEKEYNSIKINYDNFAYKGSVDWEIKPKSNWNFGLLTDNNKRLSGIEVAVNPIGRYAFADKGDMIWSAEAGKYIPSMMDAPIVISTRGIIIPEWTMKNNSADTPPESPVKPEGDPEIITLVPYGCARLRITEFPVMNVIMMENMMKPEK